MIAFLALKAVTDSCHDSSSKGRFAGAIEIARRDAATRSECDRDVSTELTSCRFTNGLNGKSRAGSKGASLDVFRQTNPILIVNIS
jgi:hypothetical protein